MKPTSKQLIHLAIIHKGEYHLIRKAIAKHQFKVESNYPHAITIQDLEYPEALRSLDQPPYVLFYKGNINHLKNTQKIAVIGCRYPSEYGQDMTRRFIKNLNDDVMIISGLARGIDGLAHQCAIYKNKCLGILGCGIDRVYPHENKALFQMMAKHHLLLSEYPDNTPGLKHHFIARNRIIAALSDTIVVMAAKEKSGTLITVDFALALNKEILVLPYSSDDETGIGCNNLIASGASMLTNV